MVEHLNDQPCSSHSSARSPASPHACRPFLVTISICVFSRRCISLWFDLRFCGDWWHCASFHLLAGCLSSEKHLFSLWLFLKLGCFFLLLCYRCSLHILDSHPLSYIWFARIFLSFHELLIFSIFICRSDSTKKIMFNLYLEYIRNWKFFNKLASSI